MNSVWGFVLPPLKPTEYSIEFYISMAGLGLLLTLQQSCFSKSMSYSTVGAVSVINYLLIPIGYFLDWLVIGQQFDTLDLIGGGLICATNIVIATLRIYGVIN